MNNDSAHSANESDLESRLLPIDNINFADIYTLISTNDSLSAQGQAFIALIERMETSTQELLTLRAITQEDVTRLKQALSSLLESIAPSIMPYTGMGLSRNDFNSHANLFLGYFTGENSVTEATPVYVFATLIILIEACSMMGVGGGFYSSSTHLSDDDHEADNDQHHYHSEAEREKWRQVGVILMSISGACFFVLFSAYIFNYIATLNSSENRVRTSNSSEDRVQTLQQNVRTTVATIYANYCAPRHTFGFFQNRSQTQPKYFNELAAKLYAEMLVIDPRHGFSRDKQKVIATLSEFASSGTVEGQAFNHMLQENTSDNMDACITRLLAIPVCHDDNGNALTLRADHMFGDDAVSYLRGRIDELREEPWGWPESKRLIGSQPPEIVSETDNRMITTVDASFYGQTRSHDDNAPLIGDAENWDAEDLPVAVATVFNAKGPK